MLVLALVPLACGPKGLTEAEDALARGDSALSRLALPEAAEYYTEALRRDSTLAEAYLKRGQVAWMGRRFEAAIADLDRALALEPGLGWAHFFRGASLFALDRLEEALPDLEAAGASSDLPAEDRARAHRMRAVVYMNTGDYPAGIDALTEAIALQPDHPFHYFERGLLAAEAGRPETAADDLTRFLEMDTTATDATEQARRVLGALGASTR